jgi:hypothetical protein
MDKVLTTVREYISRHGNMTAYAVLVVVLIALFGYFATPRFVGYFEPPDASFLEAERPAYVMPGSLPVRLRVPKLAIDAPFEEPLGLKPNKEIEVPGGFDTVGWYKYGPQPGSLGPAVVLGHVDSYEGAAVFYHLGQLAVGDSIFIDREDGTVAEFVVTELERIPQSEFPQDRVYGNIDHAGLRLVTCTGVYDHGAYRYSHNLIVYAELKEPSPAEAVNSAQ